MNTSVTTELNELFNTMYNPPTLKNRVKNSSLMTTVQNMSEDYPYWFRDVLWGDDNYCVLFKREDTVYIASASIEDNQITVIDYEIHKAKLFEVYFIEYEGKLFEFCLDYNTTLESLIKLKIFDDESYVLKIDAQFNSGDMEAFKWVISQYTGDFVLSSANSDILVTALS